MLDSVGVDGLLDNEISDLEIEKVFLAFKQPSTKLQKYLKKEREKI